MIIIIKTGTKFFIYTYIYVCGKDIRNTEKVQTKKYIISPIKKKIQSRIDIWRGFVIKLTGSDYETTDEKIKVITGRIWDLWSDLILQKVHTDGYNNMFPV